MSIYQPAEDSYLLQKSLENYLNNLINLKNKDIKILDMGSGSGIQALTCKKLGFKNLIAVDINKEAITNLKTQGLTTLQSDLFENIKNNLKFNLIIFNPPYLPEDKREPEDSKLQTTAGKKGYEIIVKFLKQARSHLTPEGSILLLFSSLSKPSIILKNTEGLGYQYKQLDRQKLPFFEELFVYEFTIQQI